MTARKSLGISRNFYLYLYAGFLKGLYITSMAVYHDLNPDKETRLKLDWRNSSFIFSFLTLIILTFDVNTNTAVFHARDVRYILRMAKFTSLLTQRVEGKGAFYFSKCFFLGLTCFNKKQKDLASFN